MPFDKKEVRDKKVTVRFTATEKELLDSYIEKHDFSNITDFIRYLIKKEIGIN